MSSQKPNVKITETAKDLSKDISGGVTQLLDDWSDWVSDKFTYLTSNIKKMRDISENNYELGTMHLQNGNISDAIFRFKIVTMMEPKKTDAWFFLGTSYMADQKMAMAVKSFDKALELKPDYEEAIYMRAVAKGKNAKTDELPRRMPHTLALSHFETLAPNYTREQLEELGYEGHRLLSQAIRAQLDDGRMDLEVLELGVGTGLCGVEIRDIASRITGVDMSGNMLAEARKLQSADGQKIYNKLIHKEMHEYLSETQAETVDMVMSAGAFSFIGELSDIYAHVARILRPGGAFAFTADPMLGDGFQLDGTAGRFRFSEQYLKSQAEAHGLSVAHMEEAPAYPAYPVWFCVFTK